MATCTFVVVPWVVDAVSLGAELAKESLVTCLVDSLVNDGAMVTGCVHC